MTFTTTNNLPNKWAVKIESEAEAVELQALFPKARKKEGRYRIDLLTLFKDKLQLNDPNELAFSATFMSDGFDNQKWCCARAHVFEIYKHTIYTLNQLKELLK
jgi:hypothetical protein